MPLDERRARHEALFASICVHDVHRWACEFLTALYGEDGLVRDPLEMQLRPVQPPRAPFPRSLRIADHKAAALPG